MPVNFSVKHELLGSKLGVTVTCNDLQYPKCQIKLSSSSFCLVPLKHAYILVLSMVVADQNALTVGSNKIKFNDTPAWNAARGWIRFLRVETRSSNIWSGIRTSLRGKQHKSHLFLLESWGEGEGAVLCYNRLPTSSKLSAVKALNDNFPCRKQAASASRDLHVQKH